MIKVIIDTNVFVSGTLWKGAPHKVLELWTEGKFKLVVFAALSKSYEDVVMGVDDQIRSIENRLTSLDQERSSLLSELKSLRTLRESQKPATLLGRPTLMNAPESNEEKTELFLTLFRSRESIYSRRWENNKTGKHWYFLMSWEDSLRIMC